MQFSDIPNMSTLLKSPILQDLPHEFAVEIGRVVTKNVRQSLSHNPHYTVGDWDALLKEEKERILHLRYQPVINATGVVIHTNLGRAPLPKSVMDYVCHVAGYMDLELNLSTGKRGGRISGIEEKLCALTGAEAALVVNNNAAAVLLVLSAVAQGTEVVVSRGELVEIGGSFRIPDVIQQGGAILKEVGCTNRTRIQDFQNAICEKTGALLRVHTSNYAIVGFSERCERSELAKLAHQYDLPLIEDLGSGLLKEAPNVPWKEMLLKEETLFNAILDGADVVTASGDKLLGGPQAGIIVGKKIWVEKCAKHPLYRALRLDKLSLAALEGVLQLHRSQQSDQLPVWQCLQRSLEECQKMAEALAQNLPEAIVEPGMGFVGGGTLPNQELPTWIVRLPSLHPDRDAQKLRRGTPAIMCRIQQDSLCFDMRSLQYSELMIIQQQILLLLNEG